MSTTNTVTPNRSSPVTEHPATERISTAVFTTGPNVGKQGVWFDGELVLVSASWSLVHDMIAKLNALIAEEAL